MVLFHATIKHFNFKMNGRNKLFLYCKILLFLWLLLPFTLRYVFINYNIIDCTFVIFKFDQSSRRIKRDKTTGGGRCTFHGNPWSFVVERTEAQQRGHFAWHRAHSWNTYVCFWIRCKSECFKMSISRAIYELNCYTKY